MIGEATLVVDCSIVMSWCFEDERTAHTDAVLDRLSHETAAAPSIWLLEVSNSLLTAERKGRISQAQSVNLLDRLLDLPILIVEVIPIGLSELISVARSNTLSAYDCAYVMLALKHSIPLATLDKQLIEAAKRLGVNLL